MTLPIVYAWHRFDRSRISGARLTPTEHHIWHPYFRPWRFKEHDDGAGINSLDEKIVIQIGLSTSIFIASYPFFAHKTGRFIALEEFYTNYEPALCVDAESPNGTAVSYMYNLASYDLYKCEYIVDVGLKMTELDPGKYNNLIVWITTHIPWKTNPNLKLSSE